MHLAGKGIDISLLLGCKPETLQLPFLIARIEWTGNGLASVDQFEEEAALTLVHLATQHIYNSQKYASDHTDS
jgi:hypothetical protein